MRKIISLILIMFCLTSFSSVKAEEIIEVDYMIEMEPNVVFLDETGGYTTITLYHDQNTILDKLDLYISCSIDFLVEGNISHQIEGVHYFLKDKKYEDKYEDYDHSHDAKTEGGQEYTITHHYRYIFVDTETTKEYTKYFISTDLLRKIIKDDAKHYRRLFLSSLFHVYDYYSGDKILNFSSYSLAQKIASDTNQTETNKSIIYVKTIEDSLEIITKNTDLAWEHINGKSYWYEKVNGKFVKQGTYSDTNGVMGDGTIRGREIFDPDSNAWYWLDSVYDGAKAVAKEVWMPYIYQNEDTFTEEQLNQVTNDSNTYTESSTTANMGEQVKKAIQNKEGKWVRYDENGKMYKGWVTLEGWNEKPEQNGNTYYYDYMTGLMAKGETIIDGTTYYFDEVTGVLQGRR